MGPVQQDLNIDLVWAFVFSGFISGFNSVILSVTGNISINNEAFLVTSPTSRSTSPTQSLRVTHRVRMYMCAFVEVDVYMRVVSVGLYLDWV